MSSNSTWTAEYAAENSSPPLMNVCISFAIIETFFIIAFVSSRYLSTDVNQNCKPVFYLMLIGYVLCISGVVVGILQITMGGAGYHARTLPLETLVIMLKLVKAQECIYVSSILFPKLAILYLYLKLFAGRTMHYIIHGTGLLIIGTFLFGFIAAFTNCRPFSSFWNREIHAQCTMDIMMAFRYYSIPNIASDAILVIIPLPHLRKVRVSVLSKIGLYLTFLLMTFGIVTAALRFTSFLDVDLFHDITYLCISTTSWTIIEPGVYLVAATIPTLRPLVRRLFKQANELCPSPKPLAGCFRHSAHPAEPGEVITPPQRALHKKSSKLLSREFLESIGHRPSRPVKLDEYHYLQDPAVMSLRSTDEESLVCADAITRERFAREGRNADGTLSTWSLQPVQLSPLRTSFLYANN